MKNTPTIDVQNRPSTQAAIDAGKKLKPGEFQCVRIESMSHNCRLQLFGQTCDRIVVEKKIDGSSGVLTQYSHHQIFPNSEREQEAQMRVRSLHTSKQPKDVVCNACMQDVFLSRNNANAPASIRDTKASIKPPNS